MKKNYTHISVLLDRSGSMGSVQDDTIGGFNTFLKDQKEDKSECTFSLIQFDHKYEVVVDFEKIQEISELTKKTYIPRGATALLDALGTSISQTGQKLNEMVEEDRPEKVLFIILTDGEENSSVEYTRDQIMEKIKHQEEKYNWKFIYLGANQDAIQESAKYGISSINTISTSNSSKGIGAAYTTLSSTVRNARGIDSTAYATMDTFTEEDRAKHENIIDSEAVNT